MKNTNPLISIITPCYNHGEYLSDARESINFTEHSNLFEWIIVNDGSTDTNTLQILEQLKKEGHCIIYQNNKGLGAARNEAIKHAKGKYILPLDCDNKIIPEVFIEAAEIMNVKPEISVVYTNALYFGEQTGEWIVGPFNKFKLLEANFIDACALIRKESVTNIGCYDEKMPKMGNEDWELWVNMSMNNFGFFYLPKIGFHYRVRSNSMVNTVTNTGYIENKNYIFTKHIDGVQKTYSDLLYKYNKSILNFNKKISKNKIKSIIKIIIGKEIV